MSTSHTTHPRVGDPIVGGPGPTTTKEGEREELQVELTYYVDHFQDWRDHEGEHVLIFGPEHHGFYHSRNEALAEGFRRFGRVAFLVKQVDLAEQPRPAAWVTL